jgi:16S rRNA (cytidine1402-2'-O)-methyltransferase
VCRLEEAIAWLKHSDNHRRGEFVLLVEGCPETAGAPGEFEPQRVLEILLEELPLKQAVGLTAEITGAKKNALYEQALKLKKDSSDDRK